jgi:L-lactate dehydrogenase
MTVEEYARQIGLPLDAAAKARIDAGTRRAAYRIIEGQGATWYGIAGGLVRICRAINRNEQSVLTVSMLGDEIEGVGPVALSLPRIVSRTGIAGTIWPSLSSAENAALTHSPEMIVKATGE